MTFQDLILSLQKYWTDHGCLYWNPWHEAVGAGTCNPATLLRVLGPEAWNVAYVEPSFRPDDGRFAENPNRMQMHHQFQVILKPVPENAQELYLGSLFQLGIKLDEHDIRFVEDNWESPALGAWGLGWEVWLDGMEVTQYTYFQQAGGLALNPPACELTYGLERIAMYLQNVKSVWDLEWSRGVSYADILKQQEIDYCEYDFNHADVSRLQQMYRLFEEEARHTIDQKLPVPAYDYVLRCSHTFNLLDSRGAVGLAERVKLFGQIRKLAKEVCELYVAQREGLGFPMYKGYPVNEKALPVHTPPAGPRDFLLEIGVEELASGECASLAQQLGTLVSELLTESRLAHSAVKTFVTPRRITAVAYDLDPAQPELRETVKGPSKEVLQKNEKARAAFCQRNGITESDIVYREEGGVEYAFAEAHRKGERTADVLTRALPAAIAKLQSSRNMRWLPTEQQKVAFNRPLRWLVALHGDSVLPVQYAGLTSDRITFGGRYDASKQISIANAESYLMTMSANNVIVDADARRDEIRSQVEAVARAFGGEALIPEALLNEVTHIVEFPTAIVGQFDEKFATLPASVVVGVLGKHLRCFPIYVSGKLASAFIAVRNGYPEKIEKVKEGYERVIRARLADAEFFIGRDGSKTLEQFRSGLERLVYHQKLGNMFAKNARIEKLAAEIAALYASTGRALDQKTLSRAAYLSKADLASQMVAEMSSLQGEMGREYAIRNGESAAVAETIRDHYYPRYAGDRMPQSVEAAILSLADRLDNLCCFFSIGAEPTGTVDPFALRRDALAILTTLSAFDFDADLATLVDLAWKLVPETGEQEQTERREKLLVFFAKRFEVQLRDEGLRHDVIRAATGGSPTRPVRARQIAINLQKRIGDSAFVDVVTAFNRCARILVSARSKGFAVDTTPDLGLLTEAAEKTLTSAVERIAPRLRSSGWSIDDLEQILAPATQPIHQFFDSVMVMAEDTKLRDARLGLVNQIVAPVASVVELTALEL